MEKNCAPLNVRHKKTLAVVVVIVVVVVVVVVVAVSVILLSLRHDYTDRLFL